MSFDFGKFFHPLHIIYIDCLSDWYLFSFLFLSLEFKRIFRFLFVLSICRIWARRTFRRRWTKSWWRRRRRWRTFLFVTSPSCLMIVFCCICKFSSLLNSSYNEQCSLKFLFAIIFENSIHFRHRFLRSFFCLSHLLVTCRCDNDVHVWRTPVTNRGRLEWRDVVDEHWIIFFRRRSLMAMLFLWLFSQLSLLTNLHWIFHATIALPGNSSDLFSSFLLR